VRSDICQPHAVLGSQEVARVLDLRQPVGLLMVAVLHFVPDEFDPGGIIATYRDAVAPGSLLAMTHVSPDNRPEPFAAVTEIMAGTRDEVHPRSYGQVAAMFAGMEPVAPGVVGVDRWRPELSINGDGAGRADIYAGVARKV
jgi:hypothetical protein